ncbi:hypothetical protein AD998_00135 [bacterium 336/3]|nr:hypothetical protein AD998_00135 [bacterium 336/3]
MIFDVQEDNVLHAKTLQIEGFFSHEDFCKLLEEHLHTYRTWLIKIEKAKFISFLDLEWLCKYEHYEQKIAVVLSKDFFNKDSINSLNTEIIAKNSIRFFNHILEARAWLFS